MPPTRRIGTRLPHVPDAKNLPDSDEEDEAGPQARAPEDPALVAARLLLERALAAAGATAEDAGCDASVCVVLVPSTDWTVPVRDAWRALVRGGERPSEGGHNRQWAEQSWAAWTHLEPSRRGSRAEHADGFESSLWRGLHCAGFSADLTWLPDDLVQAADYTLTLPVLTSAGVQALARALCGDEPSLSFSDDEAAALTPRLLRLARRLDHQADAYLRKLRDLLARERLTAAAPPVTVSPRDQPTLDRLHGMDEAVAWGTAAARHDGWPVRDTSGWPVGSAGGRA